MNKVKLLLLLAAAPLVMASIASAQHRDGRDRDGRRDRLRYETTYAWVYKGVDNSGCNRQCQYEYRDKVECTSQIVDRQMSQPVEGTRNDDHVYVCKRVLVGPYRR